MEEFNGIGIYKDVISKTDCDAFIDLFEEFDTQERTEPGWVMNRADGTPIRDTDAKDSQDLPVFIGKQGMIQETPLQAQLILRMIYQTYGCVRKYFRRVDQYLDKPGWEHYADTRLYPETFVMKRYRAPDQGYHAWHSDLTPEHADRVLVTLIYLNDVKEGGETMFCHQNISCTPEAGKLVIFPANFTHMHKGERPISNDKYILNGWIKMGEHWLPPSPAPL